MQAAATQQVRNRPIHTRNTAQDQDEERLHQLSDKISRAGEKKGLCLRPIGIEPIFDEVRLYHGARPWIVAPMKRDPMVGSRIPMPQRSRTELSKLIKAGFDFPTIYVAHELDGDQVEPHQRSEGGHSRLTDAATSRLLPQAPPPRRATSAAARMETNARLAEKTLIRTGKTLGAAAIAPLVVAAAAFAHLDPAVLGVVTLPHLPPRPGTPGAWFVLTHWNWIDEIGGSK